jgi:hypothetical protein
MDNQGVHVAHVGTICSPDGLMKRGLYRTIGVFPRDILNNRRYVLNVMFGRNRREMLFRMEDALIFDVEDNLTRSDNFNEFPGVIHPKCSWQTSAL